MNDIHRRLATWFQSEARAMPWRGSTDPYAIWLSEVILQQTRIDQGTPYFERFIASFPTVETLAAASEDAVLKQWEGLGYYTRARNLHKCAKIVVNEYKGHFPNTAEALEKLPGIGPYTAAAVASIAFDEPKAVLDGNVMRVLARLYDIAEPIDMTATRKKLWDLAQKLVPTENPGDHNQAMMELGARICMPKAPRCEVCPLSDSCLARQRGVVAERPCRREKKAIPRHEVVIAAIQNNGRYLLGKRPTSGLLGGLWEFPGGKVKPGESHEQALVREIDEELGITVAVQGLIASVNHAYSHFRVTLTVYRCRLVTGTPLPRSHTELKWVRKADFSKYAFPKANHKFLDLL